MKAETLKEIRRHLLGIDVAIRREIEEQEKERAAKDAKASTQEPVGHTA